MKTMTRTTAAALLLLMIVPVAAVAGRHSGGGPPAGELSSQEATDLLFSREEEKVARDVYISLYQRWGKAIFFNISESENTHMSVVLDLIIRYGLTDPVGDAGVGVFSEAGGFQEIYDDLVAAGSASLAAAHVVGVAIEEMDIYHLQHHIEHTDHADIRTVYENIMRASRNHLRSFYDYLDAHGIDYEPEFLSKEEFLAIATSPMERGR